MYMLLTGGSPTAAAWRSRRSGTCLGCKGNYSIGIMIIMIGIISIVMLMFVISSSINT